MASIYDETTIKMMVENNFDQYIKVMAESELPIENKVTLIYMRVKEYEEIAKQFVINASVKRKELDSIKRKYDV